MTTEYKRLLELIPKWQHVLDRVNIPTWTETLTLAYLAELASKSENIIEAGTYLGASAKVMLLANPKLKLYCIDTFTCVGEPMMQDYLKSVGENRHLLTGQICRQYTLKQECDEGRCTLILGDSSDGARHLRGNDLSKPNHGEWADAIFVDDGHAEEDVLRDIRCLMPFLKSGGQMCGHDFDVPHNDVAKGVIASGIAYDVPIPRMWRHVRP